MGKHSNYPENRGAGKATVQRLIFRYYKGLEEGDGAVSDLVNAEQGVEPDFEREKVLQKTLTRIARRERTMGILKHSLQVAATILILCAFYLVFRQGPAMSEQTAAFGEIAELTLSDGTKLWLNSGSTVGYPAEFKGHTREIRLTGEAYLDVASNPDKPFLIHTDGVVVKVLGTRFNIRAYRGDKRITVAVLEGKVRVRATVGNDHEVDVTRNQQAVYNRNDQSLTRGEDLNTERAISWKEGNLIYQAAPLPEIIADLQRKYRVKITAGRAVEDCLISADFSGEPLEKVLSILAELVNGKIKETSSAYVITGSGCRNDSLKTQEL